MIINVLHIILVTALVVFGAYYLAGHFHAHEKRHQGWVWAWKTGAISPDVKKLFRKYPDKERFILLWLQVNRLKTIVPDGAFAEVGVYRGESARILHALDPGRKLYLFDTFDGFNASDLEGEEGEAAEYSTASFADTNVALVSERLGKSNNIQIIEGLFSEAKHNIDNESFALVNLDVDLAKPTAEALEFFYPRLQPGGVIIVHDYHPKWPGLMRAVDDFLSTIPEEGVAMPDRDSSLVIVKNKVI
ncbi:MAG TPA: TylF/MycF/NovP-related O-methyltransferase [Bacteroidales bacterium]|nr:TylF/MycF/NovP-related O-methyltransferase [Bacteroidales bacterium]